MSAAADQAERPQETIDCSISDFNITLDSNQFAPRAKSGDTLMMQRGAPAWDDCIVAVDAGMQENVNGQWVDIEPGIALRL